MSLKHISNSIPREHQQNFYPKTEIIIHTCFFANDYLNNFEYK